MLIRIVVLFFVLSFSALSYAEDLKGYWDVDIPVMKGAINLSEEKDMRFSSIEKSYYLSLTDPVEVRQFYDNFFESIGWINWLKPINEIINNQNDSSSILCGWSSYHFNVNSNGAPEAVFQLMWNAEKIPAFAILRIELNDFANGKYSSKVKISIVPKIDFEAHSSKMMELFKDPKNFFILSRAVKGNPTKVENVDLEYICDIKNTDPIIEKYYNIVTDIIKEYKAFHDKYNK